MKDYTFKTVPFRILTPALKIMPVIVPLVLMQVYVKDWEHKELAAKIIALQEKTMVLNNPKRNTALVHLTAWYGLAKELKVVLPDDNAGLVAILDNLLKEMVWLEPSWQFMQQRIQEIKAAQS